MDLKLGAKAPAMGLPGRAPPRGASLVVGEREALQDEEEEVDEVEVELDRREHVVVHPQPRDDHVCIVDDEACDEATLRVGKAIVCCLRALCARAWAGTTGRCMHVHGRARRMHGHDWPMHACAWAGTTDR